MPLRPERSASDHAGEAPPSVGRLAPSPTGRLHVGHARSFLLAWWHARSRGGRIVLRIEDLDQARVRPGASEAALRDLEWLGIDWDGAPLFQSHDLEPMRAAVDELLERGLAYACTCSRKDIQSAQTAPHRGDAEMRYPGTCRGRYASVEAAERESGARAGIRLVVPDGMQHWTDELRGPEAHDVAGEVGDFLLSRRDGVYAYQLAVVVDDARQGVTEVVRGDDLVASTPRQELLYGALGLRPPRWYHVPLVVAPDGRRLSKRDDDIALTELRERGADARSLVAWAARSAGVDVAGRVTASEVLEGFALRPGSPGTREPAVFGAQQLGHLLG